MNNNSAAIKISKNVYWVGAIDNDIRNFHGYSTPRGTTYNAYLILGQEPILIDTVKPPFFTEMLARIASVIEPKKISYIISNHAEMDHSGSLLEAIQATNPQKVFASKIGVAALKEHFHNKIDPIEIKTKENFSLGDANFTCIETRMLHWPDSMFTYFANDNILFSQDGFSMHLATDKIFAEQNERSILYHEAIKYFANILMPYTTFVTALLNSLPKLGLDIKILAPDHGPIWHNANDINWIMELWKKWAKQESTDKVVICYDTMWNSTAKMAEAIADGVAAVKAIPKIMPLSIFHRTDVVAELLEAGGLIMGSPTMNNQILPTVADVLCYLKGLKPQNLLGQVFGSYGWSGKSIQLLQNELKAMHIELFAGPLKTKYVPDNDCLISCKNLGQNIAKKLQL